MAKTKSSALALVKSVSTKHTNVEKKKKIKKVKTGSGIGSIKKRHRFRPGVVANREIRKYQGPKSADLLIPKVAVFRLAKQITSEIGDYRLASKAFFYLRVIFEAEAVKLLGSANRMAIHAGRVTLMTKDFDAVTDIRDIFPDGTRRDVKHNERYIEDRNQRHKKTLLALTNHRVRSTLKDRVTEVNTEEEEEADATVTQTQTY